MQASTDHSAATAHRHRCVQGWLIGVIVGVVLLLVPIPAYLLLRRRKRKHKEAIAMQAAEATAAREKMQSRMARNGSKSFSLKPVNGTEGATAHIMVRSAGGMSGGGDVVWGSVWTRGSCQQCNAPQGSVPHPLPPPVILCLRRCGRAAPAALPASPTTAGCSSGAPPSGTTTASAARPASPAWAPACPW